MPAKTLTSPVSASMDDILTRAGAKGRASIEKHLAAVDAASAAHGKLWRKLAGLLGGLAPMPIQSEGSHVALFFIADGKYRMQVFALEDRRDGKILVYLPDIIAQAVKAKVLAKAGDGYIITGAKGPGLLIEALDASNTSDPPGHFKHMIGWNRKALRVTLDAGHTDGAQFKAVETLCAIAAAEWADKK